MPEVSETVNLGAFNLALVGMSFMISVFGSWCGLSCAARSRRRTGAASVGWLLAAAVSIGGGAIWSMHFIGMLAYESHVLYTLDIPITLASLVAGVGAAAIGLTIATHLRGTVGYIVGGVVTGAGVCVMHYLGMYAMKMNGMMSWNAVVIAISVVIAIGAATLALIFALNLHRVWAMTGGAIVMGIGVCAMHYTGMLALTVTTTSDQIGGAEGGTDPFSLALPIFGVSAILLLVLLFAGLFDEVSDRSLRSNPVDDPEYAA